MSLVASAKLCQVEPWVWLNAVLTELPVRLASSTGPPDQPPNLTDLLPDEWLENPPADDTTLRFTVRLRLSTYLDSNLSDYFSLPCSELCRS